MPTNTFNISTDLKVSGNTLIVGGLTANSLSATTFLGDLVSTINVGTGLSGNNTTGAVTLINTAPDQPVVLNNGSGISVSGAYPTFTITNAGVVSVTAGSGLSGNSTSGNITLVNTQVQGITGKTDGTGITSSISNNVITISNAGVTQITAGSGISINQSTGNVTITATGGGGGGTPGGVVNEVQYNDGAGGFGGAANVEIDSGNLKLVSTTDPSAPTGGIISYSKLIAGRHLPKIIGPSGIDTVMQVGLHGNSIFMTGPSNTTTAPTTWGGLLTTTATLSHQQTIASANPWQATRRTRFQTSTTAGNTSGMRTGYVQWFRGSAAGFGGFWFRCQLGMNINLNGGQKFVGLCALTTALAGEPSALLNMCGMGYDSTDLSTGNWQFMYNDGTGAATKVDLGVNAARNTLHGYDLIMYMAPGGSELFVRIINLATNLTVLDTSYTTLLPTANTGMAFKAEVRNGAVAAADNLEIAKVYIESDY